MDRPLEDIGFYTLSDERARTASATSPLQRCELILTSACNFKCPYCRHAKEGYERTLPLDEAKKVIDLWSDHELKNVRLSGGEPTLWPWLPQLVEYCYNSWIERIAISTNGSANFGLYEYLVEKGANDFSISFDACYSSTASKMAGTEGIYEKIVENIRALSRLTYVTVGVVLTDTNLPELSDIITMASELGVADIRIISAAQDNKALGKLELPEELLAKHPILRYRSERLFDVRGIKEEDSHRCHLALDDMAVAAGYHFPCIIYMREHGEPIDRLESEGFTMKSCTSDGKFLDIREHRAQWVEKHDTHKDPICRNNCLDVCVEYNNRCRKLQDT